jgi:hypothetical protein
MMAVRNQSQHFISMVQDIMPSDLTNQILVGIGVGLGLAGVGGAIGYRILKDRDESAPAPPAGGVEEIPSDSMTLELKASEEPPVPETESVLILPQGSRGRTVHEVRDPS